MVGFLVGSRVRINYKVADYLRFVIGEILEETTLNITVLDKFGNRVLIAKELIVELKELNRGGRHD